MKQNNSRNATGELGEVRRKHLIQEQLATLGTTWAADSCQELKDSGRRVEGGFPGTVPEARSRVQRELTRLLAQHGMEPLRPEELSAATSAAYEQAKRAWHVAGQGRLRSDNAALSERKSSRVPSR